MLKRKNLWMSLLLVLMVLTSGLQTPPVQAAEVKQGTLSVLGLDSAQIVQEKTLPFGEKETATEVLKDAVGEDKVEFTDTSYGPMLTGINGVKSVDNQFWAFFINGIAAQVGPDSYVVQNGDNITFRLTDFTKPVQSAVSLKVTDDKKNVVADLSSVEVMGTPNAMQLLQTALGTDQVGFEETQYGKMITSIKGIKAEGTNYWAFYVDGTMASVGAESYQLKNGNQISFQLESYAPAPGEGDGETEPTTPVEPTTPTVETISSEDLKTAVNFSSDYVLKNEIGDWQVIALKQAGKAIPANYLATVKSKVKEKQGKFSKITDTERYALGILAAGGNPTNVEGYNLIEAIYNGNVTKQGLNGVAYALIALESANYDIPSSAVWTKEKLINKLLEAQNTDGGWTWDEDSKSSDSDTTSMVLTALAPYKDEAGIKEKVDAAVEFLSSQYQASKIDNSSTAAQVIIALSALGINANSDEFSKENGGLVQFLLTFQNKDGGFDWQGGDVSDTFSTAQGFQALVAYQLFLEDKGFLYHFTLANEPVVKIPVSDTPKAEQISSTVVAKETGNQTGYALPNTATNVYNLLALGMLLMIAGGYFYFRQRKYNA